MLEASISRLVNIVICIFLFTSIDREFALFRFDLRYLTLILCIVVLVMNIIDIKSKRSLKSIFLNVAQNFKHASYSEVLLFSYFIIALISNISWFWNGLPLKLTDFVNLIAVFLLNLFVLVVCILNRDKIDGNLLLASILLSVSVLSISQILIHLSIPIDVFLTDASVRVIQAGAEHYNLFGQNFRISGFAEDPNYACLFNLLGIILTANFLNKRPVCILIMLLSIVGLALSWSRTIVFGSLLVTLLLLLLYKVPAFRKSMKQIQVAGFSLLLIFIFALPFISEFINIPMLQTVLTRFELWKRASELFISSPIVGNGLTAFRSYNMIEVPVWYVHCHSTFWSALSESGILGFIALSGSLLAAVIFENNIAYKLVLCTFILFCVNFDATYLQITVVILSILPIAFNLNDKNNVMHIC